MVYRMVLGMLALSSAVVMGCAGGPIPPPVLSDADLGRVIIYRNGVAYFERYAPPGEEQLTLRVPSERVDDFLKSLTIVDVKTGATMPVSFPTIEGDGSDTTMTITLPKDHHGLRITYVTESPSWKPTYRVVLPEQESQPARLLAWAVVDNVSGEDWRQVKIGVGTTSALSFRYDLHSVRLVERETLSSGTLLAYAPPTGGSPYAVAGKKVRVLGQLSQNDFQTLADNRERRKVDDQSEVDAWASVARGGRTTAGLGHASGPSKAGAQHWRSAGGAAGSPRVRMAPSAEPMVPNVSRPDEPVFTIASQLQGNRDRIRVEGFAQAGDKDPRQASLARANELREELIRQGVAAERIDAIGTGQRNDAEAVRVVAVDGEGKLGGLTGLPAGKDTDKDGKPAESANTEPLGNAHFVSKAPLTIERDHSAMVNILNARTKAERVYYYDPISERGSKKFAFSAVRLENPSPYTLDSGPVTVYAGQQFLGEGLCEPILPGSAAFIPYALDRSILAETDLSTREEIDRLLTIQRGIVTTETQQIRKTKLELTNRGSKSAKVYVRHQVQPGYELRKSSQPNVTFEKLGGAYLFPVTVAAGETVQLVIEEQSPIQKTVDIRTPQGVGAIALYLKKGSVDAKLRALLDEVVKTHTRMANLDERIQVLDEQMGVYRTRVDEINVQLVSLRQVRQATKLRQHLAAKMEEISDKLQDATMKLTNLRGERMALRIELQDKIAELTLKKKAERGTPDLPPSKQAGEDKAAPVARK